MPSDQRQPAQVSESTERYLQKLSLWDTVNIIIGIVIGVSIFKVPSLVFNFAGSIEAGFVVWGLGGILMLAGALCYSELAAALPETGGDYVFLSRTYGGGTGFLFGWAQFIVINPANIGIMSYVFADYAVSFLHGSNTEVSNSWTVALASLSVCILICLNLLGLVVGKWAQNILTLAKVIGLAAIAITGIYLGMTNTTPALAPEAIVGESSSVANLGLAMVFVLYAFGGWNDAAFVAAEVKEPGRNIPRALMIGTIGILVIYLIVNAAYLYGLGYQELLNSPTPAATLLGNAWGIPGQKLISVIIMISSLGAINGLILTGSRVNVRLGMDHRFFAMLARWNHRVNAPIYSLLAQGLISVCMIVLVGTGAGQNLLELPFQLLNWDIINWDQYGGGFETLLAATAPLFWIFFLLTGLSLILLRFKLPDLERPFRVPLYPATPLLFCGTSIYMLYSSLMYAWGLTLLGLIPILIGVPLYWLSRRKDQPHSDSKSTP
ncbi:amino acid permease [uncultured Gimesia sp.]|uniref:APC family permease n=1 Tax=uncultured Gimesia sp. TaxID=1678688 RepID=UPI0030D88660|tara:strand:+ start:27454 stop:28932 length:1479 start_codon:yes stop_codon:yes gene_type:complete